MIASFIFFYPKFAFGALLELFTLYESQKFIILGTVAIRYLVLLTCHSIVPVSSTI